MSKSQVRAIVRERAVSVDREATIAEAITAVRECTPTDDGISVYYVYVTDENELVGVVSMRELLNAVDDDPVSSIMTTELVTVRLTDPLQQAVRQIIDTRFPVLPVVDETDRFVGVVTANDVIDALDEQTTKQLFKKAGLWMR